MKSTTRFAVMGSVAALALAAAGIGMGMGGRGMELSTRSVEAPAADTKSFAGDPVHSNVIFKVKHMGASNFYGRFNKITSSFSLGETASVNVTVDAGSVDTNNSGRDTHVKSPDFFSAKEFPEITFVGKDFKKTGDGVWKGMGDLTFRGVKKAIEVEIKQTGTGKGMKGEELAGIETSFTIKRSDYGSKGLIGPVSDDVTLMVAIEGAVK